MDEPAAAVGRFKANYAVERKLEPFYKGGKAQLDGTGQHLFCVCGSRVNILDVASGAVLRSLEQEDQEDITAFDLSPDSEVLVTASRALLLAQWAWREGTVTRLWKAIHTAPVATMAFDPTSTLLATGGCDGAVRVWDVVRHYGTHHLRGSPGVVHLVAFHPDPARLLLFSSAADSAIRVWSLHDRSCLAVLAAHYSSVTSLAFSKDGHTMLSSGRDKICIVWDLRNHQVTRTVPVFESVEAAVLLPEEPAPDLGVTSPGLHFLTAGDQGALRVWEAASGQCVHTQPPWPGPGRELSHCSLAPAAGLLLTVTTDHNLLLYDVRSLQLRKQFAGYSEEVLDVRFLGPEDSHIVVASNSSCLKVFELRTSACQLLPGHTDTVLALDVFRKGWLFASCAKDHSVRIWRMNKAGQVSCVAQGSGHTHSVGAICCSRLKESFLVTGSQDCTVKLWPLPGALLAKGTAPGDGPTLLQAQTTQRCHDKDINSVAVAPNDKLMATGSQDRTAKLWALPQCQLLGVFAGHRRGVWCVQFSPMDQVLATASADGTVKLWSLQDFSCLKTFEGHDASVLKVVFVSRGTQLLSSGSDGLVKLWTIKNNECVRTLDAHEDKIWGLHCSRLDDRALTGASDSCVIVWKDVTEAEQAEAQAKHEEQVVRQQELDNLLHERRYLRALGLAISLDRPHTVLTVVQAIRKDPEAREKLEATVLRLRRDQKEALLRFCVTWNTNSRHCHEAQAVLGVLLRHEAPQELLAYEGVRATLEALLPYTERHFQRLSRTLQAATFLDFLWHNMKLSPLPAAPPALPNT
ncbi:transducin beta-like protein 3 [Ochotona curzoniae]|uniref:transducin beta-like protein 3 n=1 Tax=Ochotona curzoniae TaxID=130825 RepID=UPI001B34CFCA|nr:transducin beta-like protein 3 [Ochotona curzoniae]XP_040853393.1 transducin beta-like protein 3 [Ochotona curzoniae]